MAFGFDDFARLFDPVSDVLGTSGKQGVGLLQQKPEDLAMLAALAAGGYALLPEALPLEGAAAAEAAGPSATLVTPEPASDGIFGGIRNLFNGQPFSEPVNLNPLTEADYRALNIEQPFARTSAFADVNSVPPGLEADVNSQYYGQNLGGDMGPGIRDAALNANTAQYPLSPSSNLGPTAEEYRNLAENTARYPFGGPAGPSPEMTEFYQALNERAAAAPPSTIQQFENPASTTQNVFRGNPAEMGFQPPQVTRGGYFNNGINGEYTDTMTPLERGISKAGEYFDSASKWAEENPYPAAGLAYYTAYKTGMLDQPKQEPIASTYSNPYTMTGFRRTSPSPSAYRYTPRYAEGGIAGYARGGRSKVESAMDFYDAMNPQQSAPPLTHGDPGIYYDMDPDTRYLDPMEAAMVRMSKLNSRTNVQAPSMAPSRRMGELDFKPVAAAQGGIMGYASGGDVPVEDDEFNRLTRRGGGGRTKAEPDAKFSPTSEGAAAVSKLGQRLSAISPMVSIFAPIAGAAASAYGEHMAKNVNPNYSNEGRASLARDARVAAFDASRGGEGISGVTPGGGSRDAAPATGDAGYGKEGQHAAQGGIMGYNLGSYAAGGNPRLLRGPGDGMSDNIPATINHHQPARLADGEYVVTADVVSHLGNGSTEAGAKQLDAMMKRVRKGRTGTPKQGKQIDPRKYLPA
jgi:hypothetical protein